MGTDSARTDFLEGSNGAIKLTEDDLKILDDFYNETTNAKNSNSEGEEISTLKPYHKAAEHYINLIEGKSKEFSHATYAKLKELMASINQCGYFEQVAKNSEQLLENV